MVTFSLWVENGELDRDLLAITSDPVRYKQVPSLMPGKYVYPTESPEIVGILHAMFSDQSRLTYINEELRGDDAAGLLLKNEVAYDDFHEYQAPAVDQLIALDILENTGERVRIANAEQFLILRSLFATEACSYYHLSDRGRAEVDAMVARGWVERRASLLTEAEGQYFKLLPQQGRLQQRAGVAEQVPPRFTGQRGRGGCALPCLHHSAQIDDRPRHQAER